MRKYSQKNWQNITNSNTIDALNWKPYTVYIDNKEIGTAPISIKELESGYIISLFTIKT